MLGRKIDGVSLDNRSIRVVNEDRGDRVEPDAAPVVALKQRGADGRVVFVIGQDDRTTHLPELDLPPRPILLKTAARVPCTA